MKSNLLSIGQRIEKNYKVMIKDKIMRVLNSGGKLIMKEPMLQNETFKIELDVMEHKCMETAASKDEWIWNYKLGHLNFKDISNLKIKTWFQVYKKSRFQMKCVNNVFKQRNT